MSKKHLTRTNTKAPSALGRVLRPRPCYWRYGASGTREKMRIIFLACIIFLVSCGEQRKTLTPEMESQARKTIEAYLHKNQMPLEGLETFNSSASPKPDFGFLYTGGGRCIEFVVTCHGGNCTDWAKYPYDEHSEKCP